MIVDAWWIFHHSFMVILVYFSLLFRKGNVSFDEKENGLLGKSGDLGLKALAKSSSSESWLFFLPVESSADTLGS